MPTTPPTVSASPLPIQRGDRSTFKTRVDAFVTWLIAVAVQIPAVALNVYNNAVEALASAVAAATSASAAASSASAAASISGAVLWVSGATVVQYTAVISPANASTYRRRTATGSSTTDPRDDPTNYQLISAYVGAGRPSVDLGNSGTTTQNFDCDVADVWKLKITGICTVNVTNVPSGRAIDMRIEVVDGAAFSWAWGTTLTWVKADGTKTTSFASSGYSLLASGSSFIVLWNQNSSGPLYAKVV